MQFSQAGYPNYGQPFPFNTQYPYNVYPEVIGEGNVTSVMSPDGSTQLLFLPTTPWCKPYPCNINIGNMYYPNWNPTGAWFIRSVFSPVQPMAFSQSFYSPNAAQLQRNYSTECFINDPLQTGCAPNFELKFHNDICTSTSDIHYFFPALRACSWFQNPRSAAIQVDVPMGDGNHVSPYCRKPCHCASMRDLQKAEKTHSKENADTSASDMSCDSENICSCSKDKGKKKKSRKIKKSNQNQSADTGTSDMSCESDKSENVCSCSKDKSKKKKSLKIQKSKSKQKPLLICESTEQVECKEPKTVDKSVSTFADQASGCSPDEGRETQTTCCNVQVRKVTSAYIPKRHSNQDVKAVLWIPKTPRSKKAMKNSSSHSFTGICEGGCCSGSSSCHRD